MTRGALEESWHLGAVAVVGAGRGLLGRIGPSLTRTVVRSAIKPFQALELFASGAVERFHLSSQELALVCSSHSGLPLHLSIAAGMLERADLRVEDLQCGSHSPFDRAEAQRLRERGERLSPLHNNCSGKHAGMLLCCRARGWSIEDYLDSQHPLQEAIREHLRRGLGLGRDEPFPGAIDGCSAPTYALPLERLAEGYAALACPEAAQLDAERTQALSQLAEAMGQHPELVAGHGRFTTDLMEVTGGRILGKEGAEGVYALANRGPMPWGAALKIADGSERARDAIVLALLEILGALSALERRELESRALRPLRNHRGFEVGKIEPILEWEWMNEVEFRRGSMSPAFLAGS